MTTKELPVTNCPLKTKTLSDKRRWDAFAQQWVYEEEDVKEFIKGITETKTNENV